MLSYFITHTHTQIKTDTVKTTLNSCLSHKQHLMNKILFQTYVYQKYYQHHINVSVNTETGHNNA